jgi:hypothetical protein
VQLEREEVDPEDLLDRHVFHPPMFPGGEILYSAFFEFPDNQCESVVWRRYVAEGLASVHRMGCERQAAARRRQVAARKPPDKTYIGAATAKAGDIVNYRNPQGHGVRVLHEPKEGRHHVHLCYDSAPGSPVMTRADKNEIKLKLVEIFDTLQRHDCPDDDAGATAR